MFFFDDGEPSHSKEEQALFTASAKGDSERVALLIDQGINPKVKINGFNALHIASMKNHCLVISKIVQTHAELTCSQTEDGRTPLMIAAYQGHIEACRILESTHSSTQMVDKQVILRLTSSFSPIIGA